MLSHQRVSRRYFFLPELVLYYFCYHTNRLVLLCRFSNMHKKFIMDFMCVLSLFVSISHVRHHQDKNRLYFTSYSLCPFFVISATSWLDVLLTLLFLCRIFDNITKIPFYDNVCFLVLKWNIFLRRNWLGNGIYVYT